jgi:hypothetical protein
VGVRLARFAARMVQRENRARTTDGQNRCGRHCRIPSAPDRHVNNRVVRIGIFPIGPRKYTKAECSSPSGARWIRHQLTGAWPAGLTGARPACSWRRWAAESGRVNEPDLLLEAVRWTTTSPAEPIRERLIRCRRS